ncbi:hypothetical protein RYX36_032410 [Vicia faba]
MWFGTYHTAEKASQAYESKRFQFEMEAKMNEEEEAACITNRFSINNTISELEIKEEIDGVAEDEASDMVACQLEELEIPYLSVLKLPQPQRIQLGLISILVLDLILISLTWMILDRILISLVT